MFDLTAAIVNAFLKKNQKFYDPAHKPDYAAAREQELRQQAMGAKKNPRLTIQSRVVAGVPCESIGKAGNPQDKLVLYIHGGGFVGGCSAARRGLTEAFADTIGYNVLSVDYSLSPEAVYPQALHECLAVYREVLKKHQPDKIALLGESAGGNLVLALALTIRDRGLPLPCCIVALSPVTQLEVGRGSFIRNAKTDYIVNSTLRQETIDAYLGGDESLLNDPYVLPIRADLRGLPPLCLNYSDTEVLADDTVDFAEKARAAGVETVLTAGHKQMHTYAVVPLLRESKKLYPQIKAFLDTKLK